MSRYREQQPLWSSIVWRSAGATFVTSISWRAASGIVHPEYTNDGHTDKNNDTPNDVGAVCETDSNSNGAAA